MFRTAFVFLSFALLATSQLQAARITIPAAAFMDDERNRTLPAPSGALHYVVSPVTGGFIAPGFGRPWTTCIDAPLALPHGARITRLGLWAVDSSSGADLILDLRRKPIGAAGGGAVVENVSSIGSSSAVQVQFKFFSHVVDREGYTYSLQACLDGPSLDNVTIDYEGPSTELEGRSPVHVHPSAFRETTGRSEAVHILDGGYAHSIWGDAEALVAPLDLPPGVTLTRLNATVSNPGQNPFSIQLHRKRLSTSQMSEVIAEVFSSPLDGGIQTPSNLDFSEDVVDSRYAYYLVAWGLDGTDGQRIYDVTVEHNDLIFADGFESGDTSRWDSLPLTPTNRILIPASAFHAYVSAYNTANPPTQVLTYYVINQGMLQLEPPVDTNWYDGFCAIAPVILPDGVDILGWTLWGYDSDPDRSMTVELRLRRAINLAAPALLSSMTSFGAPNDFGQLQLVSHTVDNFDEHLFFAWCQDQDASVSDFGLRGIEVFYRP